MQAEFDVRFASLGMAAGTYNDSVTASVNGVETANTAMDAKYTVNANRDYAVTIESLLTTGLYSGVLSGATFASYAVIPYSGKVLGSSAAWTAAKITVPVPAKYVLNPELTVKYNEALGHVSNAWTITQAGPGADLIMTANLDAYTSNQAFQRVVYFAGAITDGSRDGKASAPANIVGKNLLGDFDCTGNSFSNTFDVAIFLNRFPYYQEYRTPVYVGTTDVGVYNVNGQLFFENTGDSIANLAFRVGVPAGTHSNGLVVALPKYAALTDTTAQLKAFDAMGNVLDQTMITSTSLDVDNKTTWLPNTTDNIASYQIDFLNDPNNSLGLVKFAPILTVDAVPAITTTIKIPVSYTFDGATTTIDDYTTQVTSSHTIYNSDDPKIDAKQNKTDAFQPGDVLYEQDWETRDTYKILLFSRTGTLTYPIFDGTTTVFVPLPNDTTLVSVGDYPNITQINEHGLNYARIVLPAGTNAQTATNPSYNLTKPFTKVPVTVRLNQDVTPADTIAVPDWSVAPVFMGVTGNQVDAGTWTGEIWTIDQIKAAGFTEIAEELEAAGYTQAYLNKGNYGATQKFTLSIPTSFVTDQAIKGDTDTTYVSGDGSDGIASFYPETGALSGTIRDYVGNGTDSAVTNYTSLITLPNKASGDAYSLKLTAALAAESGMTITYSPDKITGTDGNKLSDEQLTHFVDASAISDWGSVQSILITAPNLAAGELKQVIIPVVVADYGTDAATANASSFTYVDGANGIVGGVNVTLPTRIAEAQRQIKVHYVDGTGKELNLPTTMAADAGATLDLTAVAVTGYAPQTATQSYLVTAAAQQDVNFVYNKVGLPVQVQYVNQINGQVIKTSKLTGEVGDTLDLTGDAYTQLAGYTANPNNATSYVVVAAPAQTVSLYFAPQTTQLTINYQSHKGVTLLTSKVLADMLQGSTYAITAPSITGYTPDETVTNVIIKGVNPEVTLFYTPEVRDYVVNYVDAAGNAVHTSDQLTLAYDSQQTITALDIDGYQLASGQAATHTVNFAADQGTHTFTYAVANKIVTRTIEFVDDAGKELLPVVPQTVTLTTDSDGTWTTDSWPQYRTPSIAGKAADVVNVPDATVDANTADQTVTVTYHDVQLGAGIQRRSFTRTVEFVDAAGKAVAKPVTQEAQVSRTGTGAWSSAEFAAVPVPAVTGMTPERKLVAKEIVTADSKNSVVKVLYRQVEAGPGIRDYTKTVTRTVNFVDANGKTVAPSVTQSGSITKRNDGAWSSASLDAVPAPYVQGMVPKQTTVAATAITDASGDSVINVVYNAAQVDAGIRDYRKTVTRTVNFVNANGKTVAPSVTQSGSIMKRNDGAWSSASLDAVPAPYVKDMVPEQTTVAATNITEASADSVVNVVYKAVQADAGIRDYRKTVTRTINFVDANGKTVAPSVTQSGSITKRNDGAWSSASLDVVPAPYVKDMVPEQTTVAATNITEASADSVVNVVYKAVQADAGIRDYRKTVTRTINFVDANGKTVAPSVTQSGSITKRNDGAWSSASLDAVPAPYVQGMVPKQTTVAATAITDASGDSVINVVYNAAQVDAGIRDYSKTITRTIKFVDPSGRELKQALVQSVTLKRTDVDTQEGAWSTGVWALVPAPVLAHYTANTQRVAAQLVTSAMSNTSVTLVYTPQTSQPGGSGQTQPGGNTGTSTQPGSSGQTQPRGNTGTDVQPGNAGQTLPNTENDGTTGNSGASGQTQNTENTGTTAQPDDARQSLPNTLSGKSVTGAQANLSVQKQYKITAAGATNAKRGSELPQTGDALDKPGSLLGVLGLALSGLAARVFVRKHKED
jgi:LPXTG-motif cell wall-anchored protein